VTVRGSTGHGHLYSSTAQSTRADTYTVVYVNTMPSDIITGHNS
jgi:hypothetical protein